MPFEISHLLFKTFKTHVPRPLLTVEDAYVTGFLAKAAHIICAHTNLFYWTKIPSAEVLQKFFNGEILAIHGMTSEAMYRLQEHAKFCRDCHRNLNRLADWLQWLAVRA